MAEMAGLNIIYCILFSRVVEERKEVTFMEAILFMGIQAVGKSTFFRRQYFHTHVRINLDMLKTRHREKLLFEACLEMKQPFVVDNTNPTRQDRARYIPAIKTAGFRLVGFYFESRARASIVRNRQRWEGQRVPDKAIWGTAKRLEVPSWDEGFDELFYVRIAKGDFIVEEWQNEV